MRKRNIAALLLAALTLSACGGGGRTNTPSADVSTTAPLVTDANKELDEEIDYNELANIDEISAEHEEGTGSAYEPGKTAGNITALCYYDIVGNGAFETASIFAERYGGTLETIVESYNNYFSKFSVLVASGDSPDIVRYDKIWVPDGVARGRFAALDEWLDMDAPIWSDEKEIIDKYSYLGKHYYYPSCVQADFAMIYCTKSIEDAGLDNPMDLYFAGEWTWDTFEDMLYKWAAIDPDNIAFTGGQYGAKMFINTTGTACIDFTGYDYINNFRSENVTRTMTWLGDLQKQGLIGLGYVDPYDAFRDGKLLFYGIGFEWGLESAQKYIFDKKLDGTAEAVPFPRDPKADKYYISSDTFGYMVPNGAKNPQGAVQWILSDRANSTDPDFLQSKRDFTLSTDPYYYPKCPDCKFSFTENDCDELAICPECGAERKLKFKVVYSERQYQVFDEVRDPSKFGHVLDYTDHLKDDFIALVSGSADCLLDGTLYHGISHTQKLEEVYNSMEAILDEYRDMLKS